MHKAPKTKSSDQMQQPNRMPTSTENVCQQGLAFTSNRIFCADCRKDISKISRVVSHNLDYCICCFTNLEEYPQFYHTVNKLDFPLFDPKWEAHDELLLFQALQKHGFGNWSEIAEYISNGKTPHEVQIHYLNTYVQSSQFLPRSELLSRKDLHGRLIKPKKDTKNDNTDKGTSLNKDKNAEKSSISSNSLITKIKSSKSTQIVGFLPKRGEFQVEYDNDAELLLAELEFNDDDSEEEEQIKFNIIDIYNQKLAERNRRKQFVFSRNLLDLKQQTTLDKNRTKQEKEISKMMQIFWRFNTVEDHQKLIQGIIKEKELKRRAEELKELKAKGYRSIAEAEADQERERQKKGTKIIVSHNKTNPSSKLSQALKLKRETISQKAVRKEDLISKEQEQLRLRLRLEPKTYLLIRQTMIRESVRKGAIRKEDALNMFKVERAIIDSIFELLLSKKEIVISE